VSTTERTADEPQAPAAGEVADSASSAPGRRERLRAQTLRDLEDAARAEVRDHGPVGLSLRRVARRMGMSPAGLYRYVDSREELLTLLIARSYEDLADHLLASLGGSDGDAPDTAPPPVIAGPDADVADRLLAVALAYRSWSVAHPNQFGLIFGDPIPDYEAPAGGPTVAAMTRVGLALATPLIEAWDRGRLRIHPAFAVPDIATRMGPMAQLRGDLPPEAYALLLVTWGRLHGQVSLEVFGHHHWLFPEGCEALYRAEVESMLADLGVTDRPA
jgi:AcrR family transcriptional regulator